MSYAQNVAKKRKLKKAQKLAINILNKNIKQLHYMQLVDLEDEEDFFYLRKYIGYIVEALGDLLDAVNRIKPL